eukprot:472827_1
MHIICWNCCLSASQTISNAKAPPLDTGIRRSIHTLQGVNIAPFQSVITGQRCMVPHSVIQVQILKNPPSNPAYLILNLVPTTSLYFQGANIRYHKQRETETIPSEMLSMVQAPKVTIVIQQLIVNGIPSCDLRRVKE